jgi:uncharacterized membrane protein YfbV (UPF0208 family)
MENDQWVALAAVIGVFAVLCVAVYGIFATGRAAVTSHREKQDADLVAEVRGRLAELTGGQARLTDAVAELRTSVEQIERVLKQID